MAKTNDVKTALTKQPEAISIQTLVEQSAKELGRALPEHMRPERLVRIALTCIRLNPELALCTPQSFLGALFTAAQIGIEPVAGQGYLLPFSNKRKIDGEWKTKKEAQFVIGYQGLTTLFYRHEKAVMLTWGVVKEKDEFSYEKGTHAYLKHKPAAKDRGVTIGFWVLAEIQGGGKPFEYMSVEECMEHGKKHSKTYSKTDCIFYKNSPWATSPDSMCLKTVLKQLTKVLPLSVEVRRAIAADESSRDFRAGIEDALDLPPTTTWEDDGTIDAEIADEKNDK